MLTGATVSSQTPTCPLITHQQLETMRISHMVEEHSEVKDLDIICNNIMPHLSSNNNNSSSKKDRKQIIRGGGDLIPLKTRCFH